MASKLDELMELAIVAADIRSSDTAEFYAGRRVSERNYKEALAALQSALKAVVEQAEDSERWVKEANRCDDLASGWAAACAFIDSHAGDPDITAAMRSNYAEFMKWRDHIDAARKP